MSHVSWCLSHRGSLLVITLWLIMVLAMVAVALSRFLSTETRLMRYHGARAQAQAWARAGVRLAMQRLQEDTNQYDALGESWAWPASEQEEVEHPDPARWLVSVPQGTIAITITDEERKLNLNRIGEETCRAAVGQLLGGPQPADLIADYVDGDSTPLPNGLERQDTPPVYAAKNGPLAVVEEVRGIPGISAEAAMVLEEYATTVLDPIALLNINTVTRRVLEALGLSTSLIDMMLAYREGPDGPDEHEEDGIFPDKKRILEVIGPVANGADRTLLANRFGVTSQTFTIHAEGTVQQPLVRARIDAVVRRQGAEEPVILAWRER